VFRGSERIDLIINDVGDASNYGPLAALVGTA
jgi:hypothetical protein